MIIPFAPGVLSAFGLLVSDVEHDNATAFRRPAIADTAADLIETLEQLDRIGIADMARDNIDVSRIGVRRYAEMRYVGQSYELEVPIEGDIDAETLRRLVEQFHQVHERVYRQRNDGAAVEFVNIRTVHYAAAPALTRTPPEGGVSWEAAPNRPPVDLSGRPQRLCRGAGVPPCVVADRGAAHRPVHRRAGRQHGHRLPRRNRAGRAERQHHPGDAQV